MTLCVLKNIFLAAFFAGQAPASINAVNHLKTDTLPVEKKEPVIFAPGVIPVTGTNNADAVFSLDGRTVYLYQLLNKKVSIVESKLIGGKWTAPVAVSFSGDYPDFEETLSPYGKYMIFASSRPVTASGGNIDGFYNGKVFKGSGGNLWRVNLTRKGWGKPVALPQIINANSSVFSPAIAGDGSLYFMRADSGKEFHLYRSQMRKGEYETPARLSFSNLTKGDFDPAVAPDESFMVFSSPRIPAPEHTTDLFIVFRTAAGDWGEPIDLRVLSQNVYGIEARLSPDCKTLYFSNGRNAAGENKPGDRYIWQVDISGLLKAHGVVVKKR